MDVLPRGTQLVEKAMRTGRLKTLLICFLAQELAGGIAFGSFGPLLPSTQDHFAVSRAAAAVGMSLIMLSIGLLSPIFGTLLERVPVKRAMIVGTLLSAAGYCTLAITASFVMALGAYALIGTGVCLTAILGPLALVSRWFESDRGKALSFVNLPLMLFACPYVVALLLPGWGRTSILMGIAVLLLALIPLLARIDEQPGIGGAPARDETTATEDGDGLVRSPKIWLLSIGAGIVAGSGSAFYVHIVPFGIERSMSLPTASALVSSYAGAGIVGTLLFGWIADKIGAVRAFALSAALQAALWWLFMIADGSGLFLVAALLGICAVPQNTLLGAAATTLFGPKGVRAMGLSYAIKLPFLFGFAPLMGAAFDATGSYASAFGACAIALAAATAMFVVLFAVRHRGASRPGRL